MSLEKEYVDSTPSAEILNLIEYYPSEIWIQFAEYVDNSIQSYVDNKSKLREIHGNKWKLTIDIEIDKKEKRITIKDNAGGIPYDVFPRAFRPGITPSNRKGMNEYGYGMKGASYWFSKRWNVKTTAIGDPFERHVFLDLESDDDKTKIPVQRIPVPENVHYTIIELNDCFRKFPTKTVLEDTKEHIASIYRTFLREKEIDIYINDPSRNDPPLSFQDPEILNEPFWPKEKVRGNGPSVNWRIDFDKIPLSAGKSVKGFIAIRKTGDTRDNSLVIIRRGRVIMGSGENATYRPKILFPGGTNSRLMQVLYGELEVEGFSVTFNKAQIVEVDDDLETCFKMIRKRIKEFTEGSFYDQIDNYSARVKKILDGEPNPSPAPKPPKGPRDKPPIIPVPQPPTVLKPTPDSDKNTRGIEKIKLDFSLSIGPKEWKLFMYFSKDETQNPEKLFALNDNIVPEKDKKPYSVGIRVNTAHLFFDNSDINIDNINSVAKLIGGLALSQKILDGYDNVMMAKDFIRILNKDFSDAMQNIEKL